MTYRDAVLADNPRHYWEFPTSQAQLFGDLGSTKFPMILRVGSLLGGYAGPWDGGLAGAFNNGTRISTDDKEVIVAPCSMEAWIWPYSFNSALNAILVWWAAGANGARLELNAAGKLQVAIDSLTVVDPNVLPVHAWHHIVAVYSGGVATLYRDGAIVASAGGGGALGVSDAWTIGRYPTDVNAFNGMIASPAFYNYALIGAQIAAHYNAAQNKSLFPEYVGNPPGGWELASGSPSPANFPDVALILAAVRRTFPTT